MQFDILVTKTPYDIVAIGLEEIVDLNAGNMMKASTTNQRVWRDGIKKVLEEQYEGKESYVVLACEQLVGVCIIVYIRLELLSRLREVGISDVKTGLGGATGNKGSLAVRLTIDSTSFCFICSHFAAGQNEIANRNDDFNTALRKLRFQSVRRKLFNAFNSLLRVVRSRRTILLSGLEILTTVSLSLATKSRMQLEWEILLY